MDEVVEIKVEPDWYMETGEDEEDNEMPLSLVTRKQNSAEKPSNDLGDVDPLQLPGHPQPAESPHFKLKTPNGAKLEASGLEDCDDVGDPSARHDVSVGNLPRSTNVDPVVDVESEGHDKIGYITGGDQETLENNKGDISHVKQPAVQLSPGADTTSTDHPLSTFRPGCAIQREAISNYLGLCQKAALEQESAEKKETNVIEQRTVVNNVVFKNPGVLGIMAVGKASSTQTKKPKKRVVTGVFTCDVCGAKLSTRSSFAQHKKRHVEGKRFACDMCDARFAINGDLIKHKRRHTGEKPYGCDMCDGRFVTSGDLLKHRRSHTGEKPYTCEVCNARLSTRSSFVEHRRRHTDGNTYGCDACDAKFATTGDLVKHKRRHTGERPYACDLCEAKFAASGDLLKHKRRHSGDKPYSCDMCSARFVTNGELVTHKRKHSGEKPYACNICDARFSTSSYLVVHKRRHSGEKPYACDLCDAMFTSSWDFARHRRRHLGDSR